MINTIINDSNNSLTTNSNNELVGGRNQEWKQIIENICQKHFEQKTTQTVVEEMGETKENGQPRQIFPEKDLMTNLRRKSMKNWIEH